MDKQFEIWIKQELEGIAELSDQQVNQFFQYYEILIQWNQVMNLTAITEIHDVVTKHFVDSLALVKAFPEIGQEELTLIDVGTGAGFPGLPLKIAYPQLKVTLLDSLNKRIKFLEEVVRSLGLEQVELIHGRAEDFGRDKTYREKFDICVSRAVANLSTLSEYCIPFVKIGGCFIPYKSGKLEEELTGGKGAVKKLGSELEKIETFCLPNKDERSLVVIRKKKALDKKYPRKAGIPSREPLS